MNTLQPDYFDNVYAASDDPWGFAVSDYEKNKYADTLKTLPRAHYAKAFEIGCSIGVLTNLLAQKAGSLLSVDVAEKALEQAKQRCQHRTNVEFRRMNVPLEFPQSSFDLVIMSEVGYYWSQGDLERAMDLIADHVQAGGQLLLVHWLPKVHDYPLTGDEVHQYCLNRPEWNHLQGSRADRYRIDLLERK